MKHRMIFFLMMSCGVNIHNVCAAMVFRPMVLTTMRTMHGRSFTGDQCYSNIMSALRKKYTIDTRPIEESWPADIIKFLQSHEIDDKRKHCLDAIMTEKGLLPCLLSLYNGNSSLDFRKLVEKEYDVRFLDVISNATGSDAGRVFTIRALPGLIFKMATPFSGDNRSEWSNVLRIALAQSVRKQFEQSSLAWRFTLLIPQKYVYFCPHVLNYPVSPKCIVASSTVDLNGTKMLSYVDHRRSFIGEIAKATGMWDVARWPGTPGNVFMDEANKRIIIVDTKSATLYSKMMKYEAVLSWNDIRIGLGSSELPQKFLMPSGSIAYRK